MNYLDAFHFLTERLAPITIKSGDSNEVSTDDAASQITPIECRSFQELVEDYVFAKPDDPNDIRLEYLEEIEQTLATMIAVILSTTTTGGQLGLRVKGAPGSAKSTLAECVSFCTELVYARSKFTGIVSGWAHIRKSENMAAKMNGRCVLVKDADTLLQMPNLKQIESEIRDALGDGVIRAEYRTGREFCIYTLFSMILCGTTALNQMDNALLGARFLDICIHKRNANTYNVVRRAITSQFHTIASQLSGNTVYAEDEVKRKEIILKIAPPIVGFMLYKRQQIRDGMAGKYGNFIHELTEDQMGRLYAMGELVAFLRLRIQRTTDKELTYRPEKEIGTRLGESFVRLLTYLAIVFQDPPVKIGTAEFAIAMKVLRDTTDCYGTEIVFHLAKVGAATQLDLVEQLQISNTTVNNLLQDLRAMGIVTLARRISNGTTNRGNKINIYSLTPVVANLCHRAGI